MSRERKSQIVTKNVSHGVWLWRLPNGKMLCDSDGNYLSLDGFVWDLGAVRKMRKAATQHGFPEGQAVFAPGREQVTDSEYEDQMAAYLAGEDIPGDVH